MSKSNKIYVAGHRGMVGSAIVRLLKNQGYENIITRTHSELDLTNQSEVQEFFSKEKPDQVYLAAAKVGGIFANDTYPADFIYQNLMIEANVIQSAFISGVKKLLFLGSSCIYPKLTDQPIREDSLLSGHLEPTNEPYAVAKIAGIKLCESYNRQYGESHGIDYRSVMPTNLYGLGDNYHPQNSHVIPALIRRFHEAKENKLPIVEIWGTGNAFREFLYVDDMASACIHIMNLSQRKFSFGRNSMCSHINIGSGTELRISELAELIKEIVGYTGKINYNLQMPDGTPRKLLSSFQLANLGWESSIDINDGLTRTYEDFISSYGANK